MNRNPCIVIVYSTFGDGHVQAAKAIRQSFAARGVTRVHMIDLLAEAHPYWNVVSRLCYLKSSIYFPKLYGLSYDLTNQAKPDPKLNRLFHSLGKRKMARIVEQLQPDAVIHTFPYLAMSEMNGKSSLGIPTFTVLTDYVLHSRWIHPDTDRYFVATEALKQSLTTAGISESRISVSGIPIREAFADSLDRKALCQKYGLEAGKKYVLISAGAYGVLSHVQKLVQAVLAHTEFDILLVCGKNRKLHAKMAGENREPRMRVMGFVDHMEELMAVSSCLLTKAGGITLTEALSLGLPAIVYRPLPGQEKGNADVLSGMGALHTADNMEQLTEKLRQLQQEPNRKRMTKAMQKVYRSHAADVIAADVLQTVEEQSFRTGTHPVLADRRAVQAHGYH